MESYIIPNMKKNKKETVRKKSLTKNKRPAVVAVSGGFDPIHIGHVRMFNEAKKLGDRLVVILNNDHWIKKKKGAAFMPDYERKEVIEAIASVDEVILTSHSENTEDMSVCAELEKLCPNIFANGGDRKPDGVPVPEVSVCEKIGCKMIYNVGHGGKIQSSSWLLKRFKENSKQ